MTVTGFETDSNGNRTGITFIEGGMTHAPQITTVDSNNFNNGIYSDCKVIGWAEWKTE